MKKLILALCLTAGAAMANAQFKMPAPSPGQTIKQDFALGSIEVMYSRPSIKGRKIFGDLVPYNKVWRTGANTSTKIRFTDAVEINGQKIDSGTYALYTIPSESTWEIILNKGITNWGIDGYKETDDILRFRVPAMTIKPSVETFTMQIADVKAESCALHIMWASTGVAIPIKPNIKDRMRASLEKAMSGDKKPYFNAAQFYHEYDNNNAKALEAASNAVKETPKAYWIWLYKAKIEKDMGNKAAAMASSMKSLEYAREEKNADYIKMNEELQRKLK